jgi:hypothetical protein
VSSESIFLFLSSSGETFLLDLLESDKRTRNALIRLEEVADRTLAPSFSPSRNSYQAVVPYLAQQVVLRAKTQSKFATIELATTVILSAAAEAVKIAAAAASTVAGVGVEGQDLPKASSQTVKVSVPSGRLVSVNIFVTAEDGTKARITLRISREGLVVSPPRTGKD